LSASRTTCSTKADIVIAHNGIAFDTRKIQARMLFHGLNPPSPYREVDTLKIARKHFSFTSNRLDDLCQTLGIGRKLATGGFDTWLGCMRGDPKAWAKMTRYNKRDVKLLVALYKKLLPWTTVHPNLATISGAAGEMCPKCGSNKRHVASWILCYGCFSARDVSMSRLWRLFTGQGH